MDEGLDLELGKKRSQLSYTSNAEYKPHLAELINDPATVLQAVTAGGQNLINRTSGPSLAWFPFWLQARLQSMPSRHLDSIVSVNSACVTIGSLAKNHCTLPDIVDSLVNQGLIIGSGDSHDDNLVLPIAFALLGWLSMLYEPDLTKTNPGELAIADVLDGYRGASYFKLTQKAPDRRCSVSNTLLGFGLMLPKENVFTSEDSDESLKCEKIAIVRPGEFNVASLSSLAGIKVQWVDVIAPHLELDSATNTLFLYRYPSFCVANITDDASSNCKGIIHGLSLSTHEPNDRSQWACETEVTALLREILLSYRLLFAQDRASRKMFKSSHPFEGISFRKRDQFLEQICTTKTMSLSCLSGDRESYRLNRDFPVLRERLAILQHHLNNVKPRSWKAIWADKRDSAQWWTFWAVIIFGGTGIILGAMQVILQFIQLFIGRA